jgi:hypothetical protein
MSASKNIFITPNICNVWTIGVANRMDQSYTMSLQEIADSVKMDGAEESL